MYFTQILKIDSTFTFDRFAETLVTSREPYGFRLPLDLKSLIALLDSGGKVQGPLLRGVLRGIQQSIHICTRACACAVSCLEAPAEWP